MRDLADGAPRPWPELVDRKVRGNFQRKVAEALRQREAYDAENRMRHKLERWRLAGPPRLVATRVLGRLSDLSSSALVPPRVSAAVLSTMWNRWVTARRFQCSAPCVLHCSATARDSIEHYACCPVVRAVARARLGLELRAFPDAVADFVLATLPPDNRSPHPVLPRMAMLVYGTYMTTNNARRRPVESRHVAEDMLAQFVAEGARGSARAEALLR